MEVKVRIYNEDGEIIREYHAWVVEDRGDFLEVYEIGDDYEFLDPRHTIAREQVVEFIEGIRLDD